MMQRRRGDDFIEAEGTISAEAPTSSTRRRRRQRSSVVDIPKQKGYSKDFIYLLAALFFIVVILEYEVYLMIGVSMSSGSLASLAIDGDRTENVDAMDQIPNRQPTTGDQRSSSPTTIKRKWRLKSVRRYYDENSEYWKDHMPDPVPPMPPNTDPNTGEKLPPVIAYVTTLTKCDPKHDAYLDGAAVLLHSIRRNSYGWIPIEAQYDIGKVPIGDLKGTKFGGHGGRYRYRAYVVVDPQATPHNSNSHGSCARYLQKIGYTILHRAPLVPLFGVENESTHGGNQFYNDLMNEGYFGAQRPLNSTTAHRPGVGPNTLQMLMHDDGCCGYTELLKLHVYGMVDHELAVHLDFDSLLLRPMDDLFDVMLGKHDEEERRRMLKNAKLPRSKEVDFSKPIDAAFTRDYLSVGTPGPNAPVGYQGGLLVVRPSLKVLDRYRTILKRGEFGLAPRDGWGGKHGDFYGDLTFQGILPYYYEDVAPKGEHNEVELDRCVYNQMADNPRKSTYKFPRATPLDAHEMGFQDTNICRDGRKDCSDTDCQRTSPAESVSAHFTFCKKPWDCSEGLPGTVAASTCLGLLKEWYGIRRELEDWWLLTPSDKSQVYYRESETIDRMHFSRKDEGEQYFGYCTGIGEEGYQRLVEPDKPKYRMFDLLRNFLL